MADIDIDDTDFVALTSYLKGGLWTGDKLLYDGLKAKRLRTVYNKKKSACPLVLTYHPPHGVPSLRAVIKRELAKYY
ncbi:MAG: PIN domain-containing protein [Chitinophagaceae bacterium]